MNLIEGDCAKVMRDMGAASVCAIVTDPPYGLKFMGKDWDRIATSAAGGMQAWHELWAREALRVLKPGGHLLAFGGTRTWHRLAAAIEEVGFEIRDTICWLYGSGFPKSHAALRPAFEPIVLARKPLDSTGAANVLKYGTGALHIDRCRIGLASSTSWREVEPGLWRQAGCAFFPGPCLGHGDANRTMTGPTVHTDRRAARPPSGRWPANVVAQHESDCERVGPKRVRGTRCSGTARTETTGYKGGFGGRALDKPHYAGDDGMEEVEDWRCASNCAARLLDEQSGERTSGAEPRGGFVRHARPDGHTRVYGGGRGLWSKEQSAGSLYGDSGGASRFFYQPKADRSDRAFLCRTCRAIFCATERARHADHDRVEHPTVKPIDLIRWLQRLITPFGGLLLDPFAGTGTGGVAALRDGFDWIGVENDKDYCAIARWRIEQEAPLFWRATANERSAEKC